MPCILIVDDNPVQRMLVREVLADDRSLTYLEEEDGLAALERARSQCPDLVILDVILPAEDGFQICRRFKDDPDLASIPIILLTARYHDEDAQKSRQAGADGLITKPFDPQELQLTVRRMLSHASAR